MKKIINLIFTMLAMCSMGVQGQEKTEMVYPQAEWSKAGDILMYTPGQELFNGVIHPSADPYAGSKRYTCAHDI